MSQSKTEQSKTIDEQLSEIEKNFETKLQSLKDERERNKLSLSQRQNELELKVKEVQHLLAIQIEVEIVIAQTEEILNSIRMQKNPSTRT